MFFMVHCVELMFVIIQWLSLRCHHWM